MTVTPEGLRIELLESAKGTFFDRGSPEPNDSGKESSIALAKELGGVPNKISIEGHTDSRPLTRVVANTVTGSFPWTAPTTLAG